MKVEQNIVINLPVNEVFAYLSDLENLVEWTSTTVAVKKMVAGTMGVGAVVRCTVRFLGRWLEMTFEIIEREPGRCLTIKSTAGISPCLFCYQFAPTTCGGTRLSQEAIIQHMEGTIDQTMPVIVSTFRRQLANDLQTLKEILEAREPTRKAD